MLCMAEHTSMAKNCFQLVIQLASATLLLIEVVQIGTLGLLGMRRGGGGGFVWYLACHLAAAHTSFHANPHVRIPDPQMVGIPLSLWCGAAN